MGIYLHLPIIQACSPSMKSLVHTSLHKVVPGFRALTGHRGRAGNCPQPWPEPSHPEGGG